MKQQVSFSIPVRRLNEGKMRLPCSRKEIAHSTSGPTAAIDCERDSNKYNQNARRRHKRQRKGSWSPSPQRVWSASSLALLWLVVVLLYLHDDRIEGNGVATRHRNLNALVVNPGMPQTVADTASYSGSVQYFGPQSFPLVRALKTYDNVAPLHRLASDDYNPSMCAERKSDHTCSLSECTNRRRGNVSSELTQRSGYRIEHGELDEGRLGQIPQTLATNGCVISHKYKFVYIHVLKSGGMSIKTFLKKGMCGDTTMPCRAGTDVLQVVSCDSVFRNPLLHRDYLVWSVVRNPYARVYSGYAMAQAFAKNDASFDFPDFVLHPDLRSDYSDTDPVHYQPQHEFLFSSDGCPVVDYILHLETIQRDLPTLLSVLDSEELSRFYDDHGLEQATDTDYGRRQRSNKFESLEGAYTSLLQDMVVHEYATDFDVFGYDKTHIQPF